MANIITTEQLKEKLDNKEDIVLVDVLSENSYEGRHLPTAVNVPHGPDFLSQFEELTAAAKDAAIIVYCSSATCNASPEAAETLEEAGYTNVVHYKDGLAGWQEAGYAFERQNA